MGEGAAEVDDMSGERAAIFDLDGTLADSLADIAAALNGALVEAEIAPFDLAAVKSMVGAGARTLVARALAARGAGADAKRVDAMQARFVVHYEAHPSVHTQLYPGALAALEALRAQGWRLGVCTNKPEGLAKLVLDELGVAGLFGSVVGGRAGVALKPAADMVALVLVELGVEAKAAVMVGDSHADVAAAHAAGVPVILMAHGYCDGPVDALGADTVVEGFAGLAAAIGELSLRIA